jgi:hypothetical protein
LDEARKAARNGNYDYAMKMYEAACIAHHSSGRYDEANKVLDEIALINGRKKQD